MALFQWITADTRTALLARIEAILDRLGLEIDREFSSNSNIYARDKDGAKIAARARVAVIVTPSTMHQDEFLIEVRSSEPMLKRGTRCEEIASALQASIPSKL